MWMTRSSSGRLAGLQIEGPGSIPWLERLARDTSVLWKFLPPPTSKKKNSEKTVQESKRNFVKGMIYHVLAHRRGEKGSDLPSR